MKKSITAIAGIALVLTSAAAAAIDLIYVIMQRYNRSRVVKLIERNKTWTMNCHMAE